MSKHTTEMKIGGKNLFAQFFFKFYKNGDIQNPQAWSFRLWKD